jgi:hypothetical protein
MGCVENSCVVISIPYSGTFGNELLGIHSSPINFAEFDFNGYRPCTLIVLLIRNDCVVWIYGGVISLDEMIPELSLKKD